MTKRTTAVHKTFTNSLPIANTVLCAFMFFFCTSKWLKFLRFLRNVQRIRWHLCAQNQQTALFSHFFIVIFDSILFCVCDLFCSLNSRLNARKKFLHASWMSYTFWHRLNILIAIHLTTGSECLKSVNSLDDGKLFAKKIQYVMNAIGPFWSITYNLSSNFLFHDFKNLFEKKKHTSTLRRYEVCKGKKKQR